jgi:serine/threonine protein kinase
MAPEQLAARPAFDGRTDVWALGAMLYQCPSGTRPIEGRSLTELLRAIEQPKVIPLAKRSPVVPRTVSKLVARMLSAEKDLRPTLLEVHDVLGAHAARGPSRIT